MDITVRIALAPEAERALLRLIDVLGDIRNVLDREAWNARTRQEQDTGPGLPPTGEGPAEAAGADLRDDGGGGTAHDDAPAAIGPRPAGEAADDPARQAVAASGRAAAPADPPARRRGGFRYTKWSAERDAELRRGYDADWTHARIHVAVNALPGRPLGKQAVATRVTQLGLAKDKALAKDRARSPAVHAGRAEESVVLRSTARPAVVLDGTQPSARARPPAAPFRPAVAGTTERDGALSPAAMQLRADAAQAEQVEIALVDALLWGTRNGCVAFSTERPMQHFSRVNRRRAELALPVFTLIGPRGRYEALPDASVGG